MITPFDVSLPDVQGQIVTPKFDESDDIVLLVFWATWCPPCRVELQAMNALQVEHEGKGLRVYAINVDGPRTASRVRAWVEREQYRFPVLLDDTMQVLARYNSSGAIPYYVILNARGTVLGQHLGYAKDDMARLRTFLGTVLRPSGRDDFDPRVSHL